MSSGAPAHWTAWTPGFYATSQKEIDNERNQKYQFCFVFSGRGKPAGVP